MAEDAERVLRAVERAGLLAEDAVKEGHARLRELIRQRTSTSIRTAWPRLHRGTRQGRILSVNEPEIRHGRKSANQRLAGFKLHATTTSSDAPFLTAVEQTPANHQDGHQAATLVDWQFEERRPERLLAETAFGASATREAMWTSPVLVDTG